MRIFAYLIIALGLFFLGDAAYDEHRGIAVASAPGRSVSVNIAKRTEAPKGFRNLMTYQWYRGPIVLFGGLIILGFCRRAERHDPFSPDFAGNSALDELNQTLTNEQEKRRRPMK